MVLQGNMRQSLIGKHSRDVILLCIIAGLTLLFSLLSPSFFQLYSMMNLIKKVAALAIVSVGMTLIILTGGLDLSIGSSLAFAGAASAVVLNSTNSALLGFCTAIGLAIAVGAVNGLFIGRMKVNPVVFTLAMMGIARTGSLVITKASPISISNEAFKWLGQAKIGSGRSAVPFVAILIAVLFLAFSVLLRRTVFGKAIYAIGGNDAAAKVAGIRTSSVRTWAYVITGFLVGVASIFTVGRGSAAVPLAGGGLEFEAISAVIIGGVRLEGGSGSLVGTLLGVVLIGILFNGFALMDISPYWQTLAKGLLLLAAVLLNTNVLKSRD
jgi:ribose transport system permease protein